MDEVESVIVTAIAARTDRRPGLTDDLARVGIDSLSMAEIALEIEQRLGVKLDEGILNLQTVGDLVHHISLLRQKHSPPAA